MQSAQRASSSGPQGAPHPEVDLQAERRLAESLQGPAALADVVWAKIKSHPWWPARVVARAEQGGASLLLFYGDNQIGHSSSLLAFVEHYDRFCGAAGTGNKVRRAAASGIGQGVDLLQPATPSWRPRGPASAADACICLAWMRGARQPGGPGWGSAYACLQHASMGPCLS